MGTTKQKSPFLTELRRILLDGVRRIDNDQCSETDAMSMINRFNAESRGYYDKNSLLNYDEAMEMLGIRNRNKFKDTCRIHCIEQVKLNNMSVGFKRTDIEDLAYRMRKENGAD